MKKYVIIFLIISLASLGVFLIIKDLSPKEGDNTDECQSHIDFNDDMICDLCDAPLPSVCEHTDVNHDGICDADGCDQQMTVTHTDENGDGACDTCLAILDTEGQPDDPNEPCTECTDTDGNYVCDVCQGVIPKTFISLVENSTVKFSILLDRSYLSDAEIISVNEFIDYLESVGIDAEICDGSSPADSEAEIIINRVSFCDEKYDTDPHYLGPQGYAVIAEDNKILIRAGSDDSISSALSYLKEKAFTPKDGESTVTSSRFLFSDSLEQIQTEYDFKRVLIGDLDARDYKITYSEGDEEGYLLALKIRKALYERAGIWLEITASSTDDDRCIAIELRERSGGNGFYTRISSSGNLEIISEFKNKTISAGEEYLALVFGESADDAMLIEHEINTRDIFYSEFGAVGDGVTDDFTAIKATHDYANLHGHTVVADASHRYYIGSHNETVTVRTDTSWHGATFVIDDRYPLRSSHAVFTVASDNGEDDMQITVSHGKFEHYMKDELPCEPFASVIKVLRSNTVISSIIYEVRSEPDEKDESSAYGAFIEIYSAHNVSILNLRFDARIGSPTICVTLSNNVTLKSLSQENLFDRDGETVIDKKAAPICFYSANDARIDDVTALEIFLDGNTYGTTVYDSILINITSENGDINITD